MRLLVAFDGAIDAKGLVGMGRGGPVVFCVAYQGALLSQWLCCGLAIPSGTPGAVCRHATGYKDNSL